MIGRLSPQCLGWAGGGGVGAWEASLDPQSLEFLNAWPKSPFSVECDCGLGIVIDSGFSGSIILQSSKFDSMGKRAGSNVEASHDKRAKQGSWGLR